MGKKKQNSKLVDEARELIEKLHYYFDRMDSEFLDRIEALETIDELRDHLYRINTIMRHLYYAIEDLEIEVNKL